MAVNDAQLAGLLTVLGFCVALLVVGGSVELVRWWLQRRRAKTPLATRVNVVHVACHRHGCHRSRPWTDMEWNAEYGYCCPADDCESFDLNTDLGSVA